MARYYKRDKEGQFSGGGAGSGASKAVGGLGSPVKAFGSSKVEFYAKKVSENEYAIRTPDGKKIGHLQQVSTSSHDTGGGRLSLGQVTHKGFIPVTTPPTPTYAQHKDKTGAIRELQQMKGATLDPRFPAKRVLKPGTFDD